MTLARAASVLFDGMLVAAVGWGVFTAVQWPFETRLFPLTIGIPVLIVALGQLGRDIHRQLRQRADEPSPREEILDISVDTSVPAADVARRAGGFFGSALGLFGLILLVGFKVAIPVFLVVYLRFYSRASWYVTLFAVGLLLALVLGVFDHLMNVPWHRGLLEDFFPFSD